jgi:hypothetical protein
VEAEREALQITSKTIRTTAADLELAQPSAPTPPDGAAHRQNMGVFDHEQRPLRARVSLEFLNETEPRSFTRPNLQGYDAAPASGPDQSLGSTHWNAHPLPRPTW